jgi:hypothetical protein
MTCRCCCSDRPLDLLFVRHRLATKCPVKMNGRSLRQAGHGKTSGRSMPIEPWTKKVSRRQRSTRMSHHRFVLGYEYCVNQTLGGWCPTEKVFHLNRRRRWYRTRVVKNDVASENKKVQTHLPVDIETKREQMSYVINCFFGEIPSISTRPMMFEYRRRSMLHIASHSVVLS